ncbi:integral membrane protein [Talaromyces proteolyticus]|uniref:Integral membrane protein n=1 Tax=Talaromyces proteolyticus TaxID=1131652 RepID=A0AAD4KYF6_9EURO|nr:uncharacterized protein BGW36DRAFT_395169 [Talaromyces proteolyticus]KAH8702550.1 integral membrane protein [Talaromyces proteolyticus]
MADLLPPASVMATWPTPNYVDPEHRGPGLLATNIFLCSLSFVMTTMRVYTRVRITATPGMDDVFAILAFITAVAMSTISSLADARYGWDRHIWDVPMEWMPNSLKCRMTFQITFSLASTLTKISLLWFCRRILGNAISGPFRNLNYSLIASMVFLAMLSLAFIFVTLFNCLPIKASFDLAPTYSYHCLNGNVLVFVASVINLFTDLLTTVVPMPLIWRLKLPRRQRMAIIAIFGLGIVVDIVGSVRTYYVWQDAVGTWDSTWYAWLVGVTGAVEIHMGIICASAPALRPLLKTVFPHFLSTGRTTDYGYGNYGRSGNNKRTWPTTSRSQHSKVHVTSKSGDFDPYYNQGSAAEPVGIIRTVELETFVEERNDTGFDAHQSRSPSSDGLASIGGNDASSRSSLKRYESDGETPFRHVS